VLSLYRAATNTPEVSLAPFSHYKTQSQSSLLSGLSGWFRWKGPATPAPTDAQVAADQLISSSSSDESLIRIVSALDSKGVFVLTSSRLVYQSLDGSMVHTRTHARTHACKHCTGHSFSRMALGSMASCTETERVLSQARDGAAARVTLAHL